MYPTGCTLIPGGRTTPDRAIHRTLQQPAIAQRHRLCRAQGQTGRSRTAHLPAARSQTPRSTRTTQGQATGCPRATIRMLRTMKVFCYAEAAGRSGGRLCWRATCPGIPRNGSSRRCVWGGDLNAPRPSNHIGLIDRLCLKKRTFKLPRLLEANYFNKIGKSPFAAEPRHIHIVFMVTGT